MGELLIKNFLLGIMLFTSITFAQDTTHTGIDTKTGRSILLGLYDRTAFQDSNYAWWFNSGYKFYSPDTNVINKLSSVNFDSISITIVMGTWCSDSRREVPRFFKITDLLKFPESKINIIGVNRGFANDKGYLSSLHIKHVPTFIFYKNKNELGRIIETPEVSLESDMLKILKKD